jgi:hypothetical protein
MNNNFKPLLTLMVGFCFLAGCAANLPITTLKNNTKFPASTKFEVGEVKLKAGEEQSTEVKKYDFLIEKVFSDALVVNLRGLGLLANPQDSVDKVILDTEISSYSVFGDAGSLAADVTLKDQKHNIIGNTKLEITQGGFGNRQAMQFGGILGALVGTAVIAISDNLKESNVNRTREADEADKYLKSFAATLICDLNSLVSNSTLSPACAMQFCRPDGSACSGYKEPYLLKVEGAAPKKD